MLCPNCNERMAGARFGGVQANECFYCQGIWVAGVAMQELAQQSGVEYPSKSLEGKAPSTRTCHTCCQPCVVAGQNGIEIDICPGCSGTYFGKGEISVIFPNVGKASGSGVAGAYVATEGLGFVASLMSIWG